MRVCSICKKTKPLCEFEPNRNKPHGKGYRCKICNNLRRKAYYYSHLEKETKRSRKYKLQVNYNMTETEYIAINETQNGVCAICGERPKSKNLVVDHDHGDGKFRGLLCNNCNTALGLFKDNVDVMLSAISYLKNKHYNLRNIA